MLKKNSLDLKQILGVSMVALGAIGFASKAVLVKILYRYELDTITILSLRMLFSLPFFLVIILWYSPAKTLEKISPKDRLLLPLMGFLGYYLSSLLDFLGLQYISAGLERLILFIYPTIVIVLSALLFKKQILRKQIYALLLTYAGISLAMSSDFSLKNENFFLGAFFVFCSACTYSVFLIGSERIIPRVGSLLYSAYVCFFATLATLIHFIVFGKSHLWQYTWEVYSLCLLMSVIATVLPIFMTVEGIRLIGAGNMSIVGNIGPISTIVLANIFLSEPILFWQMIGTALVMIGIVLIGVKKKVKEAIEVSP